MTCSGIRCRLYLIELTWISVWKFFEEGRGGEGGIAGVGG